MQILHALTVSGQALRLKLIIHPGGSIPPLPDEPLPMIGPDVLSGIWRNLDDWPAGQGAGGYSAAQVAQIGLKYSKRGVSFERLSLTIPRGKPIIAVRNTVGRVTGLLTPSEWLTAPQPDVSNPARRFATKTIEVYPDVLRGQIEALRRNICALSLGGRSIEQISEHLRSANPEIVYAQERRAA